MREIFERKSCPVGQPYNKNGVHYAVVGPNVPTFFSVTQNGETSFYYENSNGAIHTTEEGLFEISDAPISSNNRTALTNVVAGLVHAEALELGLNQENAAKTSDVLIDEVRRRLLGTERDPNEVLNEIRKENVNYNGHPALFNEWEYVLPYQHLIDRLDQYNFLGQRHRQNMEEWFRNQMLNLPDIDECDERAYTISNLPANRLGFFNLGLSLDQANEAPLETLPHLTQYRAALVFQSTPVENINDLLMARLAEIENMQPNQRRAFDLGINFTRSSTLPENVNDDVILEYGRRLPEIKRPLTVPFQGDTPASVETRILSNLYYFFTALPIADQQRIANEILLPSSTIAPTTEGGRGLKRNAERDAEGENHNAKRNDGEGR
ncbi:MAG: hypothetical protein V4694_06220 [Pseudomonadota bacterium]